MANKRSALKAHRVAERKHARNQSARSALRTYVKKARTELSGASVEDARLLVGAAARQLDAAAGKGIIHRNQAARRKSRLMRQLNQAMQRAAEPAPEARPTRRRATREGAAPAPRATRRSSATTAGSTGTTTTRRRTAPAEPTEK